MSLRKPNIICLGAQKAGTTTLHDILKKHTDIYLPSIKEAPFFHKDENYNKGEDWWLNEFFPKQKDEKIIGAFTPDYLFFPKVADRIKSMYQDTELKLIIILRQPCERAFSHYLMTTKFGTEDLSFEDAIAQEDERLKEDDFHIQSHLSYISRGKYLEQIKRFTEFVPKENILFLSFEKDIRTNLDKTIIRIQQFMGVEIQELNTNIKSNSAGRVRSKKLETYLGKDLFIKKILRKMFSKDRLFKMRRSLGRLNEAKSSSLPKLEPKLNKALFEEYYESELDELMTLTGLDLNFWKDIN